MVQLKGSNEASTRSFQHNFNSFMVQLKAMLLTDQSFGLANFNSFMVQLKDTIRFPVPWLK